MRTLGSYNNLGRAELVAKDILKYSGCKKKIRIIQFEDLSYEIATNDELINDSRFESKYCIVCTLFPEYK